MSRIFYCLLAFFLTSQLVFAQVTSDSSAANVRGRLFDMVFLSIDGEPHTLSELRRFVTDYGYGSAESVNVSSRQFPQFVREFILLEVIEKEAQEAGITVSNDEIEAYMDEIRRQNNVDENNFSELLKSRGLKMEQYVQQIRSDILKSRVISAKVRSQVNVVDEEIDRYVSKRPELMPEEGSVHVKHVRVPIAESETSARQKALAIAKSLESGELVEQMDSQYVVDLGFVKPEELRSEISTAVSSINPGEISDVVVYDQTASVFYLEQPRGEGDKIGSAERERIREELFQRKFDAKLKSFLDEELPKKYHVEMKL